MSLNFGSEVRTIGNGYAWKKEKKMSVKRMLSENGNERLGKEEREEGRRKRKQKKWEMSFFSLLLSFFPRAQNQVEEKGETREGGGRRNLLDDDSAGSNFTFHPSSCTKKRTQAWLGILMKCPWALFERREEDDFFPPPPPPLDPMER